MLTIDEIKNVSFRKASIGNGGYRAEDVDAFIDDVIASFEQLKKEKTNLVHKIDVLATRVEQYRADEETVRNALLASQKVSDACIKEAKDKAAKIIREAEEKAQSLLVDANATTALEKENYLQLQADAVNLRGQLIDLYKKHIKNIDELPTSVDLEEMKKNLDAKYPTEEIAPQYAGDSDEEAAEQTDEATETDASQGENQDEAPVSAKPVAELTPDPAPADKAQPAPKHSSKFAHLKFGDNYDVSAE